MGNFENSTVELDILVEIATSLPGCHGARLTGGGFGGAIVALVDLDLIDNLSDRIISIYKERTGNQGVPYHCVASNGALA